MEFLKKLFNDDEENATKLIYNTNTKNNFLLS